MKGKFRICSVVEGATLAACIKNLRLAEKKSEMLEIRADFIKNIKVADVEKLKPTGKLVTIFTCRNIKEGGKFSGSRAEQAAIYNAAFKCGFNFLDIAGDSPYLVDVNEEQKKKLLLSFHDFKGTPSSIELMLRIERMLEYSPVIIKIATMVKNTKDIFTLLDVLRQRRDNQKLIVIGMGEIGRVTRILFPLLGSYVTYASAGSKTTTGILTPEQLRSVYSLI